MRATRVRTLAQSFGSAPLCETLKQWLRGYTARTHLRVHAYSFFFFLLLLSLSLPHLPFHPTATGYFTLNSNLSLPLPSPPPPPRIANSVHGLALCTLSTVHNLRR